MERMTNFIFKQCISIIALVAIFSFILHLAPALPAHASENKANKSLVVYFSMPETDNPINMTSEERNSAVIIDGKVLGNTQYIAMLIAKITSSDIFRIETVTPYPTNHRTLVDLAKQEQKEKARPAIQGDIPNIDDYTTIFIGYPNWWADMPMPLYSFLDKYDLAGKTIIPFITHGGSRFSNTIRSIQQSQPNARVMTDGYAVSRNNLLEAKPNIESWLSKFDY